MTEPRPIRVLVVDDSAFARKVLREVLSRDPRVEIVGIARDGLEALEKVASLSPDVVTLDLSMPNLDGEGVLAALADQASRPRVVVVTTSQTDGPRAVAALAAGAFDVVQKPTATASDRLYGLGDELLGTVLAAASANPDAMRRTRSSPPVASARLPSRTGVLVVGASTGGPHAVTALLQSLPPALGVPVAIVVHMPMGYTEAFAARLDAETAFRVVEASDRAVIEPNTVVIARAGLHLRLARGKTGLVTSLDVHGGSSLHRPSVDELFKSAAEAYGSAVLGVVLTGMGNDGLEGARAVRAAGGRVIVESAESCVVYGMPRSVQEAGLADAEVPIERMAQAIVERL